MKSMKLSWGNFQLCARGPGSSMKASSARVTAGRLLKQSRIYRRARGRRRDTLNGECVIESLCVRQICGTLNIYLGGSKPIYLNFRRHGLKPCPFKSPPNAALHQAVNDMIPLEDRFRASGASFCLPLFPALRAGKTSGRA
jgi:hypothetical protein